MKKQDVIDAVTYLMQDDKLRGISVTLIDSSYQTIYRKDSPEYRCTYCDSCMEITSIGGNFINKKFIPYKNILYVEGLMDK